jgi:hypothetical protein
MMFISWLNGQFLNVRPHGHIRRRVYHPLQAADGSWYGLAHFNRRHIPVRRVSHKVWFPAEEVIKHDNRA